MNCCPNCGGTLIHLDEDRTICDTCEWPDIPPRTCYDCGEPLRDDQAFLLLLEQTPTANATPTRTTGDFVASDGSAAAQEYVFPPVPLIPTSP